jgi:predicted nucleic acid-binding protein
MIFVDSNIIIDLVEPNGAWREWSEEVLLSQEAPLITSAVTLAEAARQFHSLKAELSFLALMQIELLDMPPEAALGAMRPPWARRS